MGKLTVTPGQFGGPLASPGRIGIPDGVHV